MQQGRCMGAVCRRDTHREPVITTVNKNRIVLVIFPAPRFGSRFLLMMTEQFSDNVPDHVLDEPARASYPALPAFYEDDANRQAFAAWQAQRQSKAT